MIRLLATLLLFVLAGTASALDKQPFDAARFAALQKAGEVVLIDVYAPWCSTCKKQQEVLARWTAANPQHRLRVLEVDFDDDKPSVTRFKAPRQSTLVLYKGRDQRWFSVAETRYEVIAKALDAAFSPAR